MVGRCSEFQWQGKLKIKSSLGHVIIKKGIIYKQ
jgi:hypothetical protein